MNATLEILERLKTQCGELAKRADDNRDRFKSQEHVGNTRYEEGRASASGDIYRVIEAEIQRLG